MKKAFWTVLFMAAAFCLSANSFSLQVVQRNTPEDNVFDASLIVEQTVLDYFFERGMIVSNNSVIVSNDQDNERRLVRVSSIEAKAGGMDMFVKVCLNYKESESLNPSTVLLSSIKDAELEIMSLSNSKTLAKGVFEPPKTTARNNNRGGVEKFAVNIAKEIQARIASKGGAL